MRRQSYYMDEKPNGRPSKYKPEFCEQLIQHMSEGLSFESFAAIAKVNLDTLYEWAKVHEEFSEAKKEAFANCQLYWESQGIAGLYSTTDYDEDGKPIKSKSLNSSVWIFNMKNRFKWRDKQPDENDEIKISITLADRMAKARARSVK